jgi:hypothetical protein
VDSSESARLRVNHPAIQQQIAMRSLDFWHFKVLTDILGKLALPAIYVFRPKITP